MPVINRIAGFAEDLTAWRQHIHAHPELGFDCHETAAFVVDKLRGFGVDAVHQGIAQSGLVAIINGRGDGPTIGLRADMDALPMTEKTGAAHASAHPGRMHACGHDGHTTMLLGAARYLCETRNFSGRVALIFQPAEEGGGGGRVMVNDGIMDRFDISQVYAIHTSAGFEEGTFHTCPGPIMAAVDEFSIEVSGTGGHGAHPQNTRDPVAAALQIGQAIQTIMARNVGPSERAVISLTQIRAGTAHNVIPDTAFLGGTIRTYNRDLRDMILSRMQAICDGTALSMDVSVRLDIPESLPPTVNHADEAAFAARVAAELVGADKVDGAMPPRTGGEDFGYMLSARPGAFVFVGQGHGPFVHDPLFDFNDRIAPLGASFLARLVETAQPAI